MKYVLLFVFLLTSGFSRVGLSKPIESSGTNGSGDMTRAIYDSNTDGSVNQADTLGSYPINYFLTTNYKRIHYWQFGASELLQSSSDSDYLYFGRDAGAIDSGEKSGREAGLTYTQVPAPAMVPFTGKITDAVLSIKTSSTGVALSASVVDCIFGIYLQNWTNHILISNITFQIITNSTTLVGGYSPAETRAIISLSNLNIPLTNGYLVGVKYIRGAGVTNQTRDISQVHMILKIQEY